MRQKKLADAMHDEIWEESPPRFYGFGKMARKFRSYKKDVDKWTYRKLRWLFLSDTRRIAIKYIRRGQPIKGMTQLFVVAVVGSGEIARKVMKKALRID